MPSHATESVLYGASFATPELLAVFSDENRVRKWYEVEVALARVQADLGMIPEPAAHEIARRARVENVDLIEIGRGIAETAHPIVPAIRAVEALCEDGAGEFIHYGATTQDIMDTGMTLQVRQAWPVLRRDLDACQDALVGLARTHRSTPMAGRTHGQQALPVTFGYKCAVWVDEIRRQKIRMREAETRIMTGNITGAVGSMASFGQRGREMQRRTLDALGLATPAICWHSSRDRVVELAHVMTQIAATLAKIAREFYILQQVEFGEVAEPHHHGKVGSSTMPHKRNPATLELAIGLERLVRAQQVAIMDAVHQENERFTAMLRIELAAVPEMIIYTGSLLAKMRFVLEGLEVYPSRMRANLELLGGLLLSERVMLDLGEMIGKQTAHEVVHDIAMTAYETGKPFRQALLDDERVNGHLDAARIDALLDPAGYVGSCEALVDDVVAQVASGA